MENTSENNNDPRYLLSALIEIYRGNAVYLPPFDPVMERNYLCDVFSAAISFASLDESRHTLSQEIARCSLGNPTVKEQVELAKTQTPDVLNAKMIAAAHVLKLEEDSKIKFS